MIDRRTAVIGVATAALATPALSAQAGFKQMFDGKTLDGWARIGDANWRVEDGAIVADKGAGGFLMSKDDYKDFDLRAEVWVSPDANSGIFIRCVNRKAIVSGSAYEVNLYDNRPDPSYGTGAIVGVAKVSPMPKAGGKWNVMEIIARGDAFTVILNGQKTVDGARDAALATGGVALQYGSGLVKFRKVEVRGV